MDSFVHGPAGFNRVAAATVFEAIASESHKFRELISDNIPNTGFPSRLTAPVQPLQQVGSL